MIRQDYILKMIEQAAQMLERLMLLNRDGLFAEARELETEAARKFLELGDSELDAWDDEKLYTHLTRTGAPADFPIRVGVALSLLEARAQSAADQGQKERADAERARALGLLLRAKLESQLADVPEFAPGLEQLADAVPAESAPVGTLVLLAFYHEHSGAFAAAEDTFFRLHERLNNDPDLRRLGEQFYARLRQLSDDALVAGNLPRDEVEQGAEQWSRLFSLVPFRRVDF